MATLARSLRLLWANTHKFQKSISCKYQITRVGHRPLFTSSQLLEKKFSDKHEWIDVEGTIGTIGISDYAQDKLGEVVYAQLPDEGTEYDQEDECGALESVKAASEIYSPVSGTITAKNTNVEQKPDLINSGPYTEGWLFKIQLSNPDEMLELMTEDQYKDFLKNEE